MDLLSKILSGAAGLVGKNTKALVNSVGNTAGMTKDYIDYNLAKTPQQKQQELMSYNKRYNAANEAMKNFGFDINKQGNQFDPKQYAKGVVGGSGEIGSLMSPMGGSLKARAAINAVPGFTNAISEGKSAGDTIKDTAMSMILGTGFEKVPGLMQKGLNKMAPGLKNASNTILQGQYNLMKPERNKLQLNKTIGELSDYGVKKLDDIANAANVVTGGSGVITKATRDALSKASPINTDGIMDIAKSIADDPSLPVGQDQKFLKYIDKAVGELQKNSGLQGANALDAFDTLKALEGAAGKLKYDDPMKNAYQMITDEFKDRIFNEGNANKAINLSDDMLSQLSSVSPKLADKAKNAKTLNDLRGLAAPFVRGSQAVRQSAMNEAPKKIGRYVDYALGGAGLVNPASFALLGAKKAMESDAGMVGMSNLLENISKTNLNNPITQKLFQQLGTKSVVGMPDANQSGEMGQKNSIPFDVLSKKPNTEQYNTPYQDGLGINNNQSSRSNLQQPIVPQDPMRQQAEQFANQVDPNMEIELVGADGKPTGQKVKYSELQGQLSGGGAGGAVGGGMGAPVQQDPFSEKQSQLNNAMLQALTAGDTKAFTELAKISDTMSQLQENQMKFAPGDDLDRQLKMVELETKKQALSNPKGSGKALPQTAVQELSDFDNSVSLLDNLSGVLETKKDKLGPVMGRLSKFNKYDKDAQSVQAELDIAAQVIGKALEGGKLAEGDIARYKTMLPNLNDTPELAQYKIDTLKQKIMNQKDARLQSYNSAGFNDKGLMNQNDMLAQILAAGQM